MIRINDIALRRDQRVLPYAHPCVLGRVDHGIIADINVVSYDDRTVAEKHAPWIYAHSSAKLQVAVYQGHVAHKGEILMRAVYAASKHCLAPNASDFF